MAAVDKHTVVVLHAAGGVTVEKHDHAKLAQLLGGEVSFCGGILDLWAFAIALKDPPEDARINPFCTDPKNFDVPLYGDVVLVGSDERGLACDLDAADAQAWLEANVPSTKTRTPSQVCSH